MFQHKVKTRKTNRTEHAISSIQSIHAQEQTHDELKQDKHIFMKFNPIHHAFDPNRSKPNQYLIEANFFLRNLDL